MKKYISFIFTLFIILFSLAFTTKVLASDNPIGTVSGSSIQAIAEVTAVPPVITGISAVNVRTVAGKTPYLPTVVSAIYSDNTTGMVSVMWNSISPSQYTGAGNFTVSGTVYGTNIQATANVTVVAIKSISSYSLFTSPGIAPLMPDFTYGTYSDSDNIIVQLPVVWDSINPSQYAKEGNFTVYGTVYGTDIKAIANITVVVIKEIPTVNVITEVGRTPYLPPFIDVIYGDNNTKGYMDVVWNSISSSQYATEGSFSVYGVVYGTSIKAIANVTVATIKEFSKVNVVTVVGKVPDLPNWIDVIYSDNTKQNKYVVWNSISPNQYAAEGEFTVSGEVCGISVQATANVTVVAIKEIPTVNVRTEVGIAPYLPTYIDVIYSDNTKGYKSVVWNSIASSQYASEGSFTVYGTVYGTNIQATANVTVAVIKEIPTVNVRTEAGIAPYLSTWVNVVYSDNIRDYKYVVWNSIDPSQYAGEGKFTVYGTVYGTDIKTTANITVVAIKAITPVNVRTEPGIAPNVQSWVEVIYSDNAKQDKYVVWNNINPSQYATESSFTVYGTVYGTNIQATANVTVVAIKEIKPVNARTDVGRAPYVQSGVEVVYSDNTTTTKSVVWNSINPSQYAVEGSFTVYGTVYGTNIKATANVTVVAIKEIKPLNVRTEAGTAPYLQSWVEVVFSDNIKGYKDVVWKSISPSQYATEGSFTVYGTVYGTNIQAVANVTVAAIKTIEPLNVRTQPGTIPYLPTWVDVIYSDNTKGYKSVVWNSVSPSQYATEGNFTVYGTVYGTNIKATANVSVAVIKEISAVDVYTELGKEPYLSIWVKALYSDNSIDLVKVMWNSINPSQYATEGNFTVYGSVYGANIKAIANIKVVDKSKLIIYVFPANVTTDEGKTPVLPTEVSVINYNGFVVLKPVAWSTIDPSQYAKAGKFTIRGKVDGTSIEATADITVLAATAQSPVITSIQSVNITTEAGTAPKLPTVVTTVYSDSTTVVKPVVWDSINPSQYAAVGSFTVKGKVEGTSIEATANITVTAKTSGTTQVSSGGVFIPQIPVVQESKPQVDGNGKVLIVTKPLFDKDSGVAVSEISLDTINKAFEMTSDDKKQIIIEIPKLDGTKSYIQSLPVQIITSKVATNEVILNTPLAIMKVPSNMLQKDEAGLQEKVSINIGAIDVAGLSKESQEKVGTRPVIDISVKADDKDIKWNNPSARINVSIPYVPTENELKNLEHIVVIAINSEGKTTPVTDGKYNATTGQITFTTSHADKYAVTYVEKTFSDLSDHSWAKHEIEVLASKGIINGTSEKTFTPTDEIKRADFIVMLINAMGLSANVSGNFDDVKTSDYYYNAVGIAKELGIVNGTGKNAFNPEELISRQDMMVLVSNVLKMNKIISINGTNTDTSKFTDASQVSDYAKEDIAALVKEGIIKGNGDKLNPLDKTSRAEAAVLIYKIFNK